MFGWPSGGKVVLLLQSLLKPRSPLRRQQPWRAHPALPRALFLYNQGPTPAAAALGRAPFPQPVPP